MQIDRSRFAPALLVLFFVSGLSALVYQIVWMKYLGFVFGNSVYAVATLIATYLAGLGIGGYLFAKLFRSRHPLLVYAVLEGIIGAIGSLSPRFFGLLDQAYIATYEAFAGAPVQLAVARALFAALFLLPPTILMGGTLPVLVRWFTEDRLEGGNAVSRLYAANTFGATAGVALSGFYAIPLIGLLGTLTVAVALNFVLAIVSVVGAHLTASAGESGGQEDESEPGIASEGIGLAGGAPLLLVATFLMGFSSIADEVFWSRVLVLHLGSSVYAYSLMLFAFLIGLAAGSALVARVIERTDLVRLLCLLEVGLGVVLAAQIHVFVAMPDILEWFGTQFGVATYSQRLLSYMGGVLVLILPPTMLMGATFPVVVKLYARARRQDESRAVGVVYFWNTVGSILGSLGAGFVLVRALGSQNGLFAMALLNVIIGVYFWLHLADRRKIAWAPGIAIGAVALSLLAARPDQVILSAGIFVDEDAPILLFREDVTATVTLRRMKGDWLSLELNGVNVAGTASDLKGTQKLQGHLPLLMHPDPRKVLHIGFGSGGTAYSVSLHPVDEIRIAEISPEVLEVSGEHLQSENHGVLSDPRVKTEINDVRNFVLATPETFDVILSDSIHPRYAGNGSLYTLDYFRLCREKLNPDGVISMWLPTYSMTTRNYLMILRAFQEVFPNTTVWYVPNVPNAFTIVIGRMEESPVPFDRIAGRLAGPVAEDLATIDVLDTYDIASALMLDPFGVKQLTEGVPPHVDDLPAVEYESGRLIDREGWWIRNFILLGRSSTPLARAFAGDIDPERLAEAENIRNVRALQHAEVLVRAYAPEFAATLPSPPAPEPGPPPVEDAPAAEN
jgi:spermidine synthase